MSWSIESVRIASVEPADVFALYADPSTWSAWGHNATRVRADGPLVEGGSVFVRATTAGRTPAGSAGSSRIVLSSSRSVRP